MSDLKDRLAENEEAIENDNPNIRRCLDKGYVRLVDTMGGDLSVVNAARASFAKESTELSDKDVRLIRFLLREDHGSVLRHAFFSLEVKAPLMVARQWWKYVVGSDHTMDGWNEASQRYITIDNEFYVPNLDEWRSSPENKKQGSGELLDSGIGNYLTEMLERTQRSCVDAYNVAIDNNVAQEQARGYLPAYFMYTIWRWSGSLQSLLHFLQQRLEHDAQHEITVYARAILELVEPHFPETIKAQLEKDV